MYFTLTRIVVSPQTISPSHEICQDTELHMQLILEGY